MINEKQKLLSSINSSRIRQIAEQLISLKSDVLQQDERLVAEYIFEFYEKLGLHPVKNYCTNERFNVIVELKGMDKNGKIMSYVGHMDVVPAGSLEQWTSMPYSPQVRDGKLYGRGSCDMKGSIACSMYIAELLVQHKIRLNGGLILIYNVDEESTNIGIKKYLETPRATDLVLVGEPTNMEIALWHLGVTAFTVTLHGKSVHAAMAEPGKNAVYAGAKFIELVQGLNHTLSQNEDKHLGCGSIHVTQIEGGTKVNMIPDICILRLDRRLTAGDNKETCTAQLRRLLEQVERDTGCAWEMEVTTYCPPGICEEEIESVQIIKKNIVELYHEHPVVRNFEASCEAGLISETLNVPTVIYGPGSIEQAHNVDEYIMLEQLKKGCTLYMAFMYDYLA